MAKVRGGTSCHISSADVDSDPPDRIHFDLRTQQLRPHDQKWPGRTLSPIHGPGIVHLGMGARSDSAGYLGSTLAAG